MLPLGCLVVNAVCRRVTAAAVINYYPIISELTRNIYISAGRTTYTMVYAFEEADNAVGGRPSVRHAAAAIN